MRNFRFHFDKIIQNSSRNIFLTLSYDIMRLGHYTYLFENLKEEYLLLDLKEASKGLRNSEFDSNKGQE